MRRRIVTTAIPLMLVIAAYPVDHPSRAPGERRLEGREEPDGADQWFYAQRAGPDGVLHLESRATALRQLTSMSAHAAAGSALTTATWTSLGPSNIGGRVTDIAVPTGSDRTALVATASGGAWRTTDAGATWTPVFDAYGTLAIGAVAADPTDPGTFYLGTGEANPGGGSLAYDGNGVWKSVDGGVSWSHLSLQTTGSIGRIAIDPQRPARAFVAAMGPLFTTSNDRGLFRTLDGGATWTRVLASTDSTGCIDVAIDPSNPDRVFAALWERTRRANARNYGGPTSGIWRSLDGGTTWQQLGAGLPAAGTALGRIGIAIAPSAPLTLYAVLATPSGDGAGLYRSTNGGDSWVRVGNGTADSPYCWWFGRVWADPVNANRVWSAGIGLYHSDDGGVSWVPAQGLHADHHALWIKPSDPRVMWEGNDGGVYRSTDAGVTWVRATGLPTVQLYHVDAHPLLPARVFAGAQDNGIMHTPDGSASGWHAELLGDGEYIVADPDTHVVYAEIQYGVLLRSVSSGAEGTFIGATTGIDANDRSNWSTPVVMDPNGPAFPNTRLYLGTNRLYRSTNGASSWSVISPDLTNGVNGSGGAVYGTITTVAVAPSVSSVVYAGTDDGRVWVTPDNGTHWNDIGTGLPDRWVTRIAVDPTNDAVAYATLSGLRWQEPLAHVFRTTDRGATWIDISGNLPDAPANAIVVDPRSPNILYVATDVGVFASTSTGNTWIPLGTGMPFGTVVTDLRFLGSPTPALYAATYGRSAYSIDLKAALAVVPSPSPGWHVELAEPRPNPWQNTTTIGFTLAKPEPVTLEVLDVSGRRVTTLSRGPYAAGPHVISWSGLDAQGRSVAAGCYFVRLEAGGATAVRRTIRVR